MSGTRKKISQKSNKEQNKAEEQPVVEEISEYETSENVVSEHEEETTRKMDSAETLRVGLATISKDINELKQELRHELTTFKYELKREMKEEIINLRQEIDRQLKENNNELKVQQVSISEAQERLAEVEEWKMEASTAMSEMMAQTHRMQEKITDLEGRSRRNQNLWATRRHGGELGSHIPGAASKSRTRAPGGDQPSDPASPSSPSPETDPERCAQVNYCQLSTVRDEGNDFEESLAEKATSRRQTNLLRS